MAKKKPNQPTATKPEPLPPHTLGSQQAGKSMENLVDETPVEPEEQVETETAEPETVQPRPGQTFCEACGGPMTVRSTTAERRYYKCDACGATSNLDRPPRVPRETATCPYHPKTKCKREARSGIVVDRCPVPGCNYRQPYIPAGYQPPPDDFSAR
jgi:hypothetical protein